MEDSQTKLIEEFKDCIESVLRPSIQEDGGDIEFVEYIEETQTIKIKLKGACVGCPHSQVTLKNGIEAFLQEIFPDNVKSVEQIME